MIDTLFVQLLKSDNLSVYEPAVKLLAVMVPPEMTDVVAGDQVKLGDVAAVLKDKTPVEALKHAIDCDEIAVREGAKGATNVLGNTDEHPALVTVT
jgi:hypothetical protein